MHIRKQNCYSSKRQEEEEEEEEDNPKHTSLKHGDTTVSLWGKNVHQSIAVLVESHAGRWFQQLTVDGGQDAYIVVRPCMSKKKQQPNNEKETLCEKQLTERINPLHIQN
jgi:hypothetical protein